MGGSFSGDNGPVAPALPPADSGSGSQGLVILVHGFLRTGVSMWWLARALRRYGFVVRTLSLETLLPDIPTLADRLSARLPSLLAQGDHAGPFDGHVNFVTHSMGGVVVRSLLSRHEVPGARRVVMLAPPNQGSRYAERLHDGFFRLPWGGFDPLEKLLPGHRGGCESAGEPSVEVGILAGAPARPSGLPWSLLDSSPWGSELAPGPPGEHDGKVALDETRWALADDFLVVPYGHSFLMNRREVQRQCVAFLRNGRFER